MADWLWRKGGMTVHVSDSTESRLARDWSESWWNFKNERHNFKKRKRKKSDRINVKERTKMGLVWKATLTAIDIGKSAGYVLHILGHTYRLKVKLMLHVRAERLMPLGHVMVSVTDLFAIIKDDCAGPFHHSKHHDSTKLPPDGHGHVGKGRKLVHELQQLLWRNRVRNKKWKIQLRLSRIHESLWKSFIDICSLLSDAVCSSHMENGKHSFHGYKNNSNQALNALLIWSYFWKPANPAMQYTGHIIHDKIHFHSDKELTVVSSTMDTSQGLIFIKTSTFFLFLFYYMEVKIKLS